VAARPLHLPHLLTGSPEEVSRSIPCSRDGYEPLRRGKTFTFIIGHEYGCVNVMKDSSGLLERGIANEVL